jgi:general stress protein 26
VIVSAIEELDYAKLEREVVKLLEKTKLMVLATCADDQVAARTMSCVSDGVTIYCQTGGSSTKCGQIAKNANVALCAGNMQIEGTASVMGHPLAEENGRFVELYKKKHARSFKLYAHLQDEVVIQVKPTKVTLWKYDVFKGGKSYRDFLNISDGRAYRQFTDTV